MLCNKVRVLVKDLRRLFVEIVVNFINYDFNVCKIYNINIRKKKKEEKETKNGYLKLTFLYTRVDKYY